MSSSIAQSLSAVAARHVEEVARGALSAFTAASNQASAPAEATPAAAPMDVDMFDDDLDLAAATVVRSAALTSSPLASKC